MADPRVTKFAKVLVEHSARVVPGDRIPARRHNRRRTVVARTVHSNAGKRRASAFDDDIARSDAFQPGGNVPDLRKRHATGFCADFLQTGVRAVRGAHPYPFGDEHTRHHKHRSCKSPAVSQGTVDHHRDAIPPRRREGSFKWVTTLYPTDGYAQDASMSLKEYEDFVFGAVHANEDDPVAFWKTVESKQQSAVDYMKGKSQVDPARTQRGLDSLGQGSQVHEFVWHVQHARRRNLHRSRGRLSQRLGEVHLSRQLRRHQRRRRGVDHSPTGAWSQPKPKRTKNSWSRHWTSTQARATSASSPSAPTLTFSSLRAIFCSTKRSAAPSTWRSEQATLKLVPQTRAPSTGT